MANILLFSSKLHIFFELNILEIRYSTVNHMIGNSQEYNFSIEQQIVLKDTKVFYIKKMALGQFAVGQFASGTVRRKK